MQKEILEKYPAAKLRVYVVWFSMVPTDARSRWSWMGGVLTDPRAVHFWDEKRIVGRWFAQQDPENSGDGIVWDAYYVYGPDAQWDTKPEPLISNGATVRGAFDELKNKLAPFLKRGVLAGSAGILPALRFGLSSVSHSWIQWQQHRKN